MQALIVYESMYGNTHLVANQVADGLREGYEVSVVPVARATIDLVKGADLLVFGGPTHVHGMSSTRSRGMATEAAGAARVTGSRWSPAPAPRRGSVTCCAASGPGTAPPPLPSTRGWRPLVLLTGRASAGIAHRLRGHGYRLVIDPESFLVTRQNTLSEGEAARARVWGAAVAVASGALGAPGPAGPVGGQVGPTGQVGPVGPVPSG